MQPICTHKISLQSAKPSHAYPIIRLPREFRRLAGAAATIYETTHNGALAFLVVPHRNRKGPTSDSDADIEKTSLYTAKIKRSNRFEPIVYFPNRAREISRAEDNGTNKSFFNSGSWIEYHDRQFDTFIYIDRDGSVLLQWNNVENSVRELAAL